MGFCKRCGEIVSGDRCKCGGTANAGLTNELFQNGRADSWSRNYLSKTSSRPASPTKPSTPLPACPRLATGSSTPFARPGLPSYHSAPASPTLSAGLRSPSPTRGGFPGRPPSPLKAQHTGGRVQLDADGAELRAFGCVIGKTQWCCAACGGRFRQEETIYPHPDAKTDSSLSETYFCRECFAERFSKGACVGCSFAVLSDAPFVKHDKRVWHDTCFVCQYCDAPQTDAILDFAGNPSCEDCFDAGAYKTRGIPASPHLASSAFSFKPAAPARPAPSKWGRGSISTPPKLTTALPKAAGPGSPVRTTTGVAEEAGGKRPAWRVQAERERSPMVKSFDELGDKMRKLGLEGRPKVDGRGSPWATPTATSKEKAGVMTGPALSPLKPSNALPTPTSPAKATWPPTAPSSPTRATTLAPTATATSSLHSPFLPRVPGTTKPAAAAKADPSPPAVASAAPPAVAAPISDDVCAVCRLDLGYGELVQLPKTGALMHKGCFRCKGCRQELSAGRHVDVEGDIYHQECAPSPNRYRSVITSIKEDAPVGEGEGAGAPGAVVEVEAGDDPACAGCSRLIGTAQAVTLPTSGRTFHSACFACARCKLALASGAQRSFVEVKGEAFHSACAPSRAPSPPAAARTSPLRSRTSRTTATPTLPSSASQPKLYFSPDRPTFKTPVTAPTTPAGPSTDKAAPTSTSPSALFATRARPPPRLGGLLICSGCSVRATEKETVVGPLGRRWHAKCLKCYDCARGLDSEARVGEDGQVRCEGCRRAFARRSGASSPRKWGVVV